MATASLDGILLDCSENVSSLSELVGLPFETLILTLQPKFVGTDTRLPTLIQSVHFTLTHQEPVKSGLRLTYQRLPIS